VPPERRLIMCWGGDLGRKERDWKSNSKQHAREILKRENLEGVGPVTGVKAPENKAGTTVGDLNRGRLFPYQPLWERLWGRWEG